MKKKIIILFIFLLSLSVFGKLNVTFINPGKSDETFWVMVSEFMKASANDLDIELEVLYAERNFLSSVTLMKEVTSRQKHPDYVVIVNEKLIAPRMLKISEEYGIKTFMILNGLSKTQIEEEGIPREKHKDWIGSLVPNNEDAGFMIADSIIKAAAKKKKGNLKMIAIAGNRVTPASVKRVSGLIRALKENHQVLLLQTLYAEWSQDEAYIMIDGMLNRYKDFDLVWAINDPSALGALDAIKDSGFIAGKDVFISGLNWSIEAIKKIKSGELVSSVGGHFMVGGWSLVMLRDYHEGIDFAENNNELEHQINVFSIIDSSNANKYLKYFGDSDWDKIDFKKFSKVYNPDIKEYNFSLEEIFKQF